MHETDKTKLSDQTKLRLYEIKYIENYFINEINQRKSYSKKLNNYVIIFDYIDKILIILSATTSEISIISFASVIGTSVGIVSASFTLIFSLLTGIIKKLLNMARNISQALNDLDISHEEFLMILNEKDKYEKMKYNLISENGDEKQKIVKLSSI